MSERDNVTVAEVKELVIRELPRWLRETPAFWDQLDVAWRERPSRLRMSYDEFLAWADEDTLAEWVDGEVIMYSPASRRHQDIADFLTSIMRSFVEQWDLGVILSTPFQMKLSRSGREPDLLFVARERLDRLKATYLDGPADLAVEIVSAESERRDRVTKFYEYQAEGVREYWLIDPNRRQAEFCCLGEDGRYEAVQPGEEGKFHSQTLPGFWLRAEWLWREPLPAVARTAWEIMGVEELHRLLAELGRPAPAGDEE